MNVKRETLSDLLQNSNFQNVALPGGKILPARDRTYLHQPIFGERGDDLKGKALFEIGCNLGHLCLDAMHRGARRVIGLDVSAECVELARELAANCSLVPEYIHADFERWDSSESFDVIVCLNVLHHMYDPIHALRKMMHMARQKIILEFAVPTQGDVSILDVKASPEALLQLPAVFQQRTKNNLLVAERTYAFTPAAMEVIFNHHCTAFEPVRSARTPREGRFLIEARKREIEYLTVVAGPPGSGKSTFIDLLVSDEGLRRQLGLPTEISASMVAMKLAALPAGPLKHVVLHYDFLRPYGMMTRSFDRDSALDLVNIAPQLTFLTLMTPRQRLRMQMRQRGAKRGLEGERMENLYQRYSDSEFLRRWYKDWYQFCHRHADRTVRNVIVENRGEYRYHPASNWEQVFAQHFAA